MQTLSIDGGCACGAVRYRVTGPCTNSMICHCRTCRRTAASPVVAWVTFPVEHFSFLHGQPAEYRSSTPVRRMFCRACGSHLTYTHTNEPAIVDVTTCSLDDPGAFPPTHHSWLSHDIAWVGFADGLPTFKRSRYDGNG